MLERTARAARSSPLPVVPPGAHAALGTLARGCRASLFALILSLAGAAFAQVVPYTVQVVALSDLDAAQDIQNDLLRAGFPAYVVRSMSEQGEVFRVRVGAFADRNAALLYASGMPAMVGGEPVPALAELIPQGIMPLAPRILLDLAMTDVDVALAGIPQGIVLRLRPVDALQQAEYAVIVDGVVRRYRAWRLGVDDDGSLVRVREMLLWPENWANDADEVRAGFRSSLLALVAERLGVPLGELAAAEYRPDEDEPPRLLVVERGTTSLLEGAELLGVGLPAAGMEEFGPVAFLHAPAWPEDDELPVLENAVAAQDLLAADGPVMGTGWEAVADGAFVRLTVTDPEAVGAQSATAAGTTWRAGLGAPLWSDGRYLLAMLDGRLLVYDFVVR